MGAPEVSLTFIEKGITAIQRGERGVVLLLLKDTKSLGSHTVLSVSDIPDDLSELNQWYIQKALLGYQVSPRRVLVYVMNSAAEDISTEYKTAETMMETTKFDWLAIPTIETDEKTEEIASWIKTQRTVNHRTVKAVLPNSPSDTEGVVNLTSSLFKNGTEYEPEQVTPRIAGLIAGTPMTIACTYAPLTDFDDCTRLAKADLDDAVDDGEFVFEWDGEKVKVCRGVNSFVTTVDGKGESFKKIKIVEIMDMIQDDIVSTARDSYIGKYANSYDNKCLLITAINAYFAELVRNGLLASGTCEINLERQKTYLGGKGIDTSDMSDEEIKQANTGSYVFLKATISILDAMEDIEMEIYI